jgi:polynucleotide kinase-phosphatase
VRLVIPELSLVALVGPSGCGKSTFARKHFKPTEVLSSDFYRGLVSDDENDQAATPDAFAALHFIAGRRLARGKFTVVDATNVQAEARKPLVALAREYHVIPVAIVFDLPVRLCEERNRGRPERDFGAHVIRQQASQLKRSLRGLQREGFRHVFTLKSPDEVEAVEVERQPLWNNQRRDHGPFDIIGDAHGCADELEELLAKLGYAPDAAGVWRHQEGRKAVFLGDLVDRGPRIPDVLKVVMRMVGAEAAYCVPGNHDIRLMRRLRGREVKITHGLRDSLEQLEREPPEFRKQVADFIDDLVSHYVFDDGKLVVAHAGMKEEMQGRGSGKVRDFALYSETTGESDEFGLPRRFNWAAEYRGRAMVVYGHTPTPEPEWLNRTINIDSGCVFGGKLTALRYPERELVAVSARKVYAVPVRPLVSTEAAEPGLSAQQAQDDLLDIADVSGKRRITTRLYHEVTIREEHGIAALDVLSRFAANPKWLVYLPPTMPPPETTTQPGLLEHPAEAFAYFRHSGVPMVVYEEKHMGSRAVVIVCRDEDVARRRFGVVDEGIGICYTRTGRRFFDEPVVEQEVLRVVGRALEQSGFWEKLKTGWVLLDCELMPWSAKAQELIRRQYAAVGASASAALPVAIEALQAAAERDIDVAGLLERYQQRWDLSARFVESYRHYCWPVESVKDLKLAPFHVLATDGMVHVDKDHVWHMQTLGEVVATDSDLLIATQHRPVDLTDPASETEARLWWEALTDHGGEGIVVKPLSFVARGRRGLLQPAIKVRGREYLRIIYGPEYTNPENLDRLRRRALSFKRSLALREFALGIEGLERFVRGEPLRRTHECVFGVLALESEPVDPRL